MGALAVNDAGKIKYAHLLDVDIKSSLKLVTPHCARLKSTVVEDSGISRLLEPFLQVRVARLT